MVSKADMFDPRLALAGNLAVPGVGDLGAAAVDEVPIEQAQVFDRAVCAPRQFARDVLMDQPYFTLVEGTKEKDQATDESDAEARA